MEFCACLVGCLCLDEKEGPPQCRAVPNHCSQATSTLSLAAASASASITVSYFNDLGHCNFGEECQKYQISVACAFMRCAHPRALEAYLEGKSLDSLQS